MGKNKPAVLKPVNVENLVKKAKKEGFVTQETVLKYFPDAEKKSGRAG